MAQLEKYDNDHGHRRRLIVLGETEQETGTMLKQNSFHIHTFFIYSIS